MIVAAAVCPHPPLLVPDLARGAAGELDACRAAAQRALRTLAAARPDRLVAVGAGERTREHQAGASGSLRPFGVDVRVSFGHDDGRPATLPLSLTVAAWLLARSGWDTPVSAWEVSAAAAAEECAATGRSLAGDDRVALLVMADGTARRGAHAPGALDPRAVELDDTVEAALSAGDPETLAGLDPDLADQLWCAGRPAWQVMAGATAGGDWDAEMLYADDPYGVWYVVSTWVRGRVDR